MHYEFGCTGEIRVRQVHRAAPIGNVDELLAIPTGYELHFGSSPHNPDGTFQQRHLVRQALEQGDHGVYLMASLQAGRTAMVSPAL